MTMIQSRVHGTLINALPPRVIKRIKMIVDGKVPGDFSVLKAAQRQKWERV